jgi:hypothetical protein
MHWSSEDARFPLPLEGLGVGVGRRRADTDGCAADVFAENRPLDPHPIPPHKGRESQASVSSPVSFLFAVAL